MTPFQFADGKMLPIAQDNVDTDIIVPQRWLVTVDRSGLSDAFMGGWRYDRDGHANPTCVVNDPVYSDPVVLIARQNYGCGSSREHAVWAHAQFGIRAIVAVSFGPIFYENCLKNGLLPVVLATEEVDTLLRQAIDNPGCGCRVDLTEQVVVGPDNARYQFSMDAGRRQVLLDGLDDIELTLRHRSDILAFQKQQAHLNPWLR